MFSEFHKIRIAEGVECPIFYDPRMAAYGAYSRIENYIILGDVSLTTFLHELAHAICLEAGHCPDFFNILQRLEDKYLCK